MKKILFFILLIPTLVFSQTEFTEIVEVDSLKKATLYSNSLSWFAKTFKSANDVIQMKDAETGKVIGTGILNSAPKSMGVRAYGSCFVTITISCKDNKYKYEFTDVYFKYQQGGIILKYADGKQNWKDEVSKEIGDLINSLKSQMETKDEF